MNFSGVYQREKRNPSQMYHPMHHSVASYWTEAFPKSEMKHGFNDELFLNNIHLIPDPLKKNLADTLFNNETPKKPEKAYRQDQKMNQNDQKVPFDSRNMTENPPRQANPATALGGISSFFSGVMNVLTSVMFRSRSPVNYYDCFDVENHQGSARNWQPAKTDERDKNGQADDLTRYDVAPSPNESSDMNFDSRATVTSCESKLNQVLHLLTPRQTSSPVWVRKRPKKAFVEPGSVEESFEDAFSPEDFGSLSNDSYIEYYSPMQYHCEDLYETAAPKTLLNMAPVEETADIVKDVTNKSDLELKKDDFQLENDNVQLKNDEMHLEDKMQLEKGTLVQEKDKSEEGNLHTTKSDLNLENKQQLCDKNTSLDTVKEDTENPNVKNQLVSSCEDKLSKLKALLQEKRMKCTRGKKEVSVTSETPPKSIDSNKKTADKRFKNPNRRCSKRPKSKLKCRIEDDLVFANEISLNTPPSTENSPMQHTNVSFGDYFDEVSGRFRTASTGSDDSFQIVFNDCRPGRVRTTSDCDSEDSFIVFEDSPESCYTSNDVFGDSDNSDSEVEMSDSGCGMVTCKLAHTLTRTVSNLADDSLYVQSEDEVDFSNIDTVSDVVEEQNTGLLLDERKKLLRKCQPAKKVRFSSDPPKVHVLRVWAFAARQARAGHWERYAIDRERFKRRIADADMALSWVLKPQHRRRVMFQRFMPWWNQIKRKELAEKKDKEEDERRKEEDRKREAEDRSKENHAENNEKDEDTSKEDYTKNNEKTEENRSKDEYEEKNEEEDKLEAERSDIISDKRKNLDLTDKEQQSTNKNENNEIKSEELIDSQNPNYNSVKEITIKEDKLAGTRRGDNPKELRKEETRRRCPEDDRLQFNNELCNGVDGNISSDSIYNSDDISKKIQDLNLSRPEENSDCEKVYS